MSREEKEGCTLEEREGVNEGLDHAPMLYGVKGMHGGYFCLSNACQKAKFGQGMSKILAKKEFS